MNNKYFQFIVIKFETIYLYYYFVYLVMFYVYIKKWYKHNIDDRQKTSSSWFLVKGKGVSERK